MKELKPLHEYPRLLWELEEGLAQSATALRDAKYALDREETRIKNVVFVTKKAEYTNKEARDAALDELRAGETYMEVSRRVDSCTEGLESARRNHRRLRRGWRVAQILAQSRIIAHYERLKDVGTHLPPPVNGLEEEDTGEDAPFFGDPDDKESGPAF